MSFATVLFLLAAVACWGGSAFFDKLSFRYFPGPTAATDVFLVRLALTIALLLLPVALRWGPVCGAGAAAGRAGILLVCASVATAMSGVYFYLVAMSGAEASKIVPLSSTYPLFTFLLAMLFLGESFTVNKLFGTVFVCLGVFFLSR